MAGDVQDILGSGDGVALMIELWIMFNGRSVVVVV
jgi:hypothetical protein